MPRPYSEKTPLDQAFHAEQKDGLFWSNARRALELG
jgi:hypothetical protein